MNNAIDAFNEFTKDIFNTADPHVDGALRGALDVLAALVPSMILYKIKMTNVGIMAKGETYDGTTIAVLKDRLPDDSDTDAILENCVCAYFIGVRDGEAKAFVRYNLHNVVEKSTMFLN